MTTPFLEVKNLNVSFPTEDGEVMASQDISFNVALGETLAIVGESGSGKSVSNLAVMGLHNRARTNISGEAWLNLPSGPVDVISAPEESVRRLRGKSMAMIFQDPMSALHPYYSIGDQLSEAWRLYNEGSKSDGLKRAAQMLDLVGIPDASRRVNEYPHQFSGGMRQRVMIAMALINNPSLLIADEPTTALDVTVQSQILQLLRDMQKEFNMAVILITHDLGVVAEVADRVNVMYAGKIVEQAGIDSIYYDSLHPYTMGLLSSIPRVDQLGGHRLKTIPGQPPSLIGLPSGCSFRSRCEYAGMVSGNLCATEAPLLDLKAPLHSSRCHLSIQQLNDVNPSDVRSAHK
ncbi:MAG: ABC transporter ATP-binding protein [Actinomycetes bacterium]